MLIPHTRVVSSQGWSCWIDGPHLFDARGLYVVREELGNLNGIFMS